MTFKPAIFNLQCAEGDPALIKRDLELLSLTSVLALMRMASNGEDIF
jgi:hypothetical protein